LTAFLYDAAPISPAEGVTIASAAGMCPRFEGEVTPYDGNRVSVGDGFEAKLCLLGFAQIVNARVSG
jgi:hypothetical protein